MAQLRGKGAFTGVNLLASAYYNGVTKDGKTRFIDVMVDHRDPRGQDQTNLHLTSQRTEDAKGNTRYNNGAPYSVGQFQKIMETAGPNVEPILSKDGKKIGMVFAVKANLMPSAKGNGLVLNSESLAQSDFKIDDHTMKDQFTSMAKAREAASKTQASAEKATDAGPSFVAGPEGVEAPAQEEPAVG